MRVGRKGIIFTVVTTAILGGLYILISWFLLNGRLTYWTSSNPGTIEESKSEAVFISDKLHVQAEGDSLVQWQDKFEIWTNRRQAIKYWGVLFHWTFKHPSWRYLNINPRNGYVNKKWSRSKLTVNQSTRDFLNESTGGWESCCNRISCKQGDTIRIEFVKMFDGDVELGSLTVVVD